MALRVLFVQSQTEIGGAETVLLNVLPALPRARVEPAVATLGFGQGRLPAELRAAGIEVFELAAGRLRNPCSWLRTVARLCGMIRGGGFHAVVANGYHPHLYAHPATRLARARSVVFCHDIPRPRRQAVLIERLSFALRADGYLAPGPTVAQAVKDRVRARRPVLVVPNGLPLERFRPDPEARAALRAELGLAAEHVVVTVAGRLSPAKGQHVFLDAAARVAAEFPPARFLVVGDALFGMEAGYPEQLRRQAQDLGIADRVTFTGNRTDMPAVYAASDMVAMSSLEPEGFGMVVAEAMAAGRPVVVARAGGAAELFEEGASGLGYEPGNAHELAGRILHLCRDVQLRERLGQAARVRAAERYSAEASAQALADALGAPAGGLRQQPDELSGERSVPGVGDPGATALQLSRYRLAAEQLKPGMRVLDLACGVGVGTQILASSGSVAVGLDLSLPALRYCRKIYGQGPVGFAVGNAFRLPFPAAAFDAVVCFEFLEHVREQNALLAEIRRVLRPPGLLFLSTPNRLTEKTLEYADGPGVTPFHIGTLKPAELNGLLRRHFEDVEILGYRRTGGSRLYRCLRSLDVFNLRLRLGRRARDKVARTIKGPPRTECPNPECFELTARGLRQAITLLAICRRARRFGAEHSLAVLTAAYPPDLGGVADHSRWLAEALAREAPGVEVFTTSRAGPAPGSVPVVRLEQEWSLSGARRVADALAAGEHRAVLFQYVPHLYGRAGICPGAALLPLLCRRRGLKVLTHFHEVCVPWSVNPLRLAQSVAHRLQAWALIAGSGAAAFSNRRYARICRAALAVFRRPWAVLASGPTIGPVQVAPDRRAAARARWAQAGESLVVVYGLASRGKQYELAVEALAELRRRGRNLRLLMLGDQEAGDRAYCREIRERIRRLGLEVQVTWSGPLPGAEVAEALAAADFMWHVQRGGVTTRNGTVASALAQGLPVVALAPRTLDEPFRDGENVLLTGPSGGALAEAAERVLASPELAAKLRSGAGRLHQAAFAWPAIAGGCLRLLEGMGVRVDRQ